MIRRLLFYPLVVASTLLFSTIAAIGGLVRAPKGLYDWVHRNWARSILRVAGVTLVLEGLEHVRPNAAQIFVCNHQSGFDIWALMAGLPASLRFVAKQELNRIPIFSTACRSAGHVFIDRRNPAEAGRAIRKAGVRMRDEGLSLVFFPEGTRSGAARMRRFKKGPFTLAIETQADLVAVAVHGGTRILGDRPGRLSPGTIRLRCAPPVPLRGMTAEDRDALARRTEETVRQMLAELRGEEDAGGSQEALSVAPGTPTIRRVEPGA